MSDTALDPGYAELELILQTVLELGVQVQMAGGYTARVRTSMHDVALAMGAERAHTWVQSGSVGCAVYREGWSRTAVRSTPEFGVDFTRLSQLSSLTRRADGLSLLQFRAQLTEIAAISRRYPVWLVLIVVGVSCASFAALSGAGPVGIALAGLGAYLGASVRLLMHRRNYKPFMYCLVAGFSAASVVFVGGELLTTSAPIHTAATASILFLIPGVPMLNGTADLLTSNYLNGVARLTRAAVILFGTTLGLALASLAWGQV